MRWLRFSRVRAVSAWLAILFFVTCSKKENVLSGRVIYRGEPVAGAKVEVYLERGDFSGGTPFMTGETDENGRFELETGKGEFYLVVRKTVSEGGRRVVIRGRPSVEPVGPGIGRILIELKEVGGRDFKPDGVTFIEGVVEGGGEGVYVYAYDGRSKAVGPGYLTEVPVAKDGRFRLPLREGVYRIVAMKKQTGGDFGPPELWGRGEYRGNPVRLEKGTVLNIGVIKLERIDEKTLDERSRTGGLKNSDYRITGKVVDENGLPVPHVYVMAYDDSGMRGRPVAVAETSEKNGSFLLLLPSPGKYYVGARENLGGPASPGELTGVYEGSPDRSIVLKGKGEKRGIVIVVREKW